MNGSSIQPERAWQMALDQLRLDMPKASFDTWVRDTKLRVIRRWSIYHWHTQRLRPRVAGKPLDQHRDPPADRHLEPTSGSPVRCHGRNP